MQIKPPGFGKPPLGPTGEPAEAAGKPGRKFEPSVSEPPPLAVQGQGVVPLPGIAAQCTRADLADPVKRETMIRSSLSEMMETRFPVLGAVPDAARKFLIDWMGGDPMIRRQLERCLERMLK